MKTHITKVLVMESLTTLEIGELEQCESVIEQGLKTFVDVGNALLKIRDGKLYRIDFGTFEDYCKERWNMQRAHAYRLIDAANVVNILSPTGDILPTTERVARPLTQLEPEDQPVVWQKITETAPNGKVTAAHAQSVVNNFRIPQHKNIEDEFGSAETVFSDDSDDYDWTDDEDEELKPDIVSKPHVSHNSGNNEWYTPLEYIEAARRVLGVIELDPASSPEANKVVQAETYYTENDNGLEYEWHGKVWMNPPYAAGLVDRFASKIAYHVERNDVHEAIVLVNNATETGWFNEMVSGASAVIFPKSRVKFWKPNGDTGAPLQGQALIYFGKESDLFLSEFSSFGWGAKIVL